jgi:hypothetical protein
MKTMGELLIALIIIALVVTSGLALEPNDPPTVYGTVIEIRGPESVAVGGPGLILQLDSSGGRTRLTVSQSMLAEARIGDRWKRADGVWVGPLR